MFNILFKYGVEVRNNSENRRFYLARYTILRNNQLLQLLVSNNATHEGLGGRTLTEAGNED